MRCRSFLCLPLLVASSCTWWSSREDVLISSDPLGARILVDGQDTGRTTPAKLQIGGNFGRNHVVELVLAGHQPARRTLYQHTEGYTSQWIDGVSYTPTMTALPLFWTAGDVFFPFGVRGGLVPHELYVKLYRDSAPKLGFDVLADRAAAGTNGVK